MVVSVEYDWSVIIQLLFERSSYWFFFQPLPCAEVTTAREMALNIVIKPPCYLRFEVKYLFVIKNLLLY